MVENAEQLLLEHGFRQFRVRMHGRMARIEVMPEEFLKLLQEEVREDIVNNLSSRIHLCYNGSNRVQNGKYE